MKELIGAALGPSARNILLFDPPPRLCARLNARPETDSLTIVTSTRRRMKKCLEQLSDPTRIRVFLAEVDHLPLLRPEFDAIIVASGLPAWEEPLVFLKDFRRLVRPCGAVMVVTPLREGAVGQMSSLTKRIVRRRALPTASELTASMLLAGLRKVRQATLRRSVVPTVVTWAEARPRPWEADAP